MDANSCYDHLNEVAMAMHDQGALKGHIVGALVRVAAVISAAEFIDAGVENPEVGAIVVTGAYGAIVKSVFDCIDDDLRQAARTQRGEDTTCH